jgi:hypothetical protein
MDDVAGTPVNSDLFPLLISRMHIIGIIDFPIVAISRPSQSSNLGIMLRHIAVVPDAEPCIFKIPERLR